MIQPIIEQLGLEVIEMKEKGFIDNNLDRALLGLMAEAEEFPGIVSYTAQADPNDTTAMIQSYLD